MVSTKTFLHFVVIAGLVSLFSACSPLVTKQETIDEEAVSEEIALEHLEPEERIITPNPYFLQPVEVDQQTQEQFQMALDFLRKEAFEEAELRLTQINERYPTLSGPLVNLGIIQYRQDIFDKAEMFWQKAIDVNDLNFDAYNYLSLLYREQGKFDESEKMYQSALVKWKDNAEIHCNLGILYDLYIGKPRAALDEYKLCQLLTEEPSRQLRGWIVDLERRLPAEPILDSENERVNEPRPDENR